MSSSCVHAAPPTYCCEERTPTGRREINIFEKTKRKKVLRPPASAPLQTVGRPASTDTVSVLRVCLYLCHELAHQSQPKAPSSSRRKTGPTRKKHSSSSAAARKAKRRPRLIHPEGARHVSQRGDRRRDGMAERRLGNGCDR